MDPSTIKPHLCEYLSYNERKQSTRPWKTTKEELARYPRISNMASRNKISVALLSLVLMGLLLCHLATTASAEKDEGKSDSGSSESEGRVVYADLKLADSESPSDAPAPAPGPVTSSSDNGGEN